MKKYFILVIVILLLGYFSIEDGESSIEDALDINSKYNYEIKHIEEIGNDYLVFSFLDDYIHISHIRKNIRGFRTIYSGVAGDISRVLETKSIFDFTMPGLDNKESFRYLGLLSSNDAKKLTLIDTKNNEEVTTRIIDKDGFMFWISESDIQNRERVVARITQVTDENEIVIDLDLFVFN